MIVRGATIEDVEGAARCHLLSSNAAYGREDDFERRLRSTRDAFEMDDVRNVVAEEGGEIVGIANLSDDELYALYVHPDRWGTGVGQALIDRVHELLAATCDEARLTVLTDNARARRFYERNGWQFAERLTELHFDGEETDVCRYIRSFNRPASPS